MLPAYNENTVIVLSKIDFEKLTPGMHVGYINRDSRNVVHVLVEKDALGWRVKGLNNTNEDRDRVTRYNLLGVVYASFPTATEQE